MLSFRNATGSVSALLLIALSGCSSSTAPIDRGSDYEPAPPIRRSGTYTRQLEINLLPRDYRIYVPESVTLNTPTSVIMVLHGNPPIDMAPISEMNIEATERGVVVVYPNSAFNAEWVHACNCTANGIARVDDRKYFEALLDDLEIALPGGVDRAFMSGFSNGGMMTHTMACELSDRIDGFAVVSAGMWTWTQDTRCFQSSSAKIVMFNGTTDPQFPWDGMKLIVENHAELIQAKVPDTAAWWAGRNACQPEPMITALPDLTADGTTVERWEYQGCAKPTVFYAIDQGGHTWPGMPVSFGAGLGNNSQDISATRIMVDFFLGPR